MEIPLFQEDEPLHFEHILLYPYPDLRRIWVRMWLSARQDQQPNIEVRVTNPDGSENNSLYLLAHAEPKVDATLHLRDPVPGETYSVVAEMTLGLSDPPEILDRHEFDLVLEFRNPEEGEPGFGIGLEDLSPPGSRES
jgi:hypothetical protein